MDAPEPGRDRDGAAPVIVWKVTAPSRRYDKRYELMVNGKHRASLYFTYTLDRWDYETNPQANWPDWDGISHAEAQRALADPASWWMEQLL